MVAGVRKLQVGARFVPVTMYIVYINNEVVILLLNPFYPLFFIAFRNDRRPRRSKKLEIARILFDWVRKLPGWEREGQLLSTIDKLMYEQA